MTNEPHTPAARPCSLTGCQDVAEDRRSLPGQVFDVVIPFETRESAEKALALVLTKVPYNAYIVASDAGAYNTDVGDGSP